MTQHEWLVCTDPRTMLEFLGTRASDRKLRLFAAVCFRRDWSLLTDGRSREAIIVGERFADGQATSKELKAAQDAAMQAAREIQKAAFDPLGRWRTDEEAEECHRRVGFSLASNDTAWGSAMGATARRRYQTTEEVIEARAEAVLLRHLIGDPFRPRPTARWPETVVQLADTLYNGEDCGFALADALEEAGHAELADHFRQEQRHPKGCWVLDLLLGKG